MRPISAVDCRPPRPESRCRPRVPTRQVLHLLSATGTAHTHGPLRATVPSAGGEGDHQSLAAKRPALGMDRCCDMPPRTELAGPGHVSVWDRSRLAYERSRSLAAWSPFMRSTGRLPSNSRKGL